MLPDEVEDGRRVWSLACVINLDVQSIAINTVRCVCPSADWSIWPAPFSNYCYIDEKLTAGDFVDSGELK